MGEYLSKPIVDKTSNNEHFAHLSYGASTMQGWRSSQEDAHNCIPEFDENTALFAVYDGHGGSSVAKYCSTHLPNYISTLESYKSGNIAQALEDGFLGFDGTLTNENVIEILRNLSRDATDIDEDNSIPDEDELQELRREAEIPTETLKEYYQYKQTALEDTEENPQSPSSKAKPSVTSEKNSSIKNDEESADAKCKLANGESGDTDAESTVKDGDAKIVKKCDGEKPSVGPEEPTSSTCTDKGKKLVKGGKRATDAGVAKPGCSSLDEPGPSQHPEPKKRERKLPVVTQVGSDSEDSDMEDETYEGDALDESESDNDDDEKDDDDDESSEEDEEKDCEEEDDSLELAKLQELDLTFNSGCTAVVAILRGCELYVANAGDSRCVVSRKGKAIEMSVDHKPEDELEKKRIANAGGKILAGRINGDLNLSRALGDHRFKQNKELEPKDQMISALPDIRTLTIDPEEDEFLILACDGIWNYMNSQEVVDFVRKRLTDDMEEISSICEQLFDHCLAPDTSGDGTGCDNMTAIIVKFHQTLGQHVSAKSTHKSHKVKEHEKPELKEWETECKKAKVDSGSQQTSEADS